MLVSKDQKAESVILGGAWLHALAGSYVSYYFVDPSNLYHTVVFRGVCNHLDLGCLHKCKERNICDNSVR